MYGHGFEGSPIPVYVKRTNLNSPYLSFEEGKFKRPARVRLICLEASRDNT